MSARQTVSKILKYFLICIIGGLLNYSFVKVGLFIHITPTLFFDTVIPMAFLFAFGFWPAVGSLLIYYVLNVSINTILLGYPLSNFLYAISGIIIILVTWLLTRKKTFTSSLSSFLYLFVVILAATIASCISSGFINFIVDPYAYNFYSSTLSLPALIIERFPVTLIDRIITTILGYLISIAYNKLKERKGLILWGILISFTGFTLSLIFYKNYTPQFDPNEKPSFQNKLNNSFYALYDDLGMETFDSEMFLKHLENFRQLITPPSKSFREKMTQTLSP